MNIVERMIFTFMNLDSPGTMPNLVSISLAWNPMPPYITAVSLTIQVSLMPRPMREPDVVPEILIPWYPRRSTHDDSTK